MGKIAESADLEGAGGELDSDGGLGVEGEAVLGEAREQVGLPHAGVADEHHLEEVVVLVAALLPRRRPPSHALLHSSSLPLSPAAAAAAFLRAPDSFGGILAPRASLSLWEACRRGHRTRTLVCSVRFFGKEKGASSGFSELLGSFEEQHFVNLFYFV